MDQGYCIGNDYSTRAAVTLWVAGARTGAALCAQTGSISSLNSKGWSIELAVAWMILAAERTDAAENAAREAKERAARPHVA